MNIFTIYFLGQFFCTEPFSCKPGQTCLKNMCRTIIQFIILHGPVKPESATHAQKVEINLLAACVDIYSLVYCSHSVSPSERKHFVNTVNV